MKPTSFIALVLSVFALSCDTDKNVAPSFETFFTKYYGEDGNQEAADILLNDDGTMVMLANSTSQTNSQPTPFIVKVDGQGNVIWQRRLGGANERARDLEADGNGNMMAVSNILNEPSQMRVFRIDQSGKTLDSTSIDNPKNKAGDRISQTATSITRIQDGKFLIAGSAGPDYILEGSLIGDESDLLMYRYDPITKIADSLTNQGGERVGELVKAFQTRQTGNLVYLQFGSSDRPLSGQGDATGLVRRSFEIIKTDYFGGQGGARPLVNPLNQTQIASTVIDASNVNQESYLMVGTVLETTSIFVAQYVVDGPEKIIVRLAKSLPLGGRMEGISASMNGTDGFLILGNVYRDNNNRDISLIKLAGDGTVLGQTIFGSVEGDDSAGAVRVLADGRIVVFATIQLETQKKLMLVVLSPDGTFTGN